MTYNPNKSAYNKIMKNISRMINAKLNESYRSEKISTFIKQSKEYFDELNLTDSSYQILGIGVYGITKIICIEPNTDISKTGVSDFIDVNIINDSQLISSIADEECVGNIMNNQQIVKKHIFKPQNRKRYFLICYSYDAIIGHNSNTIIMDPRRFQFALEIKKDAIEKHQSNEYNKYNNKKHGKDEFMPKAHKNKSAKYEKDVLCAFEELSNRLPARKRDKATKIYQQITQLLDSVNELFFIVDNKKLMTQIINVLNEAIK